MKPKYIQLVSIFFVIVGVTIAPAVWSGLLLAPYFDKPSKNVAVVGHASSASRYLYAVNQSSNNRGSISVYDIGAGHRLVKTIQTVAGVGDVKGVAASAVTGKLYVAYRNDSGVGMIYCLNLYNDVLLWNRVINPGVDRLSTSPDGQLLYVPTWENGSANYINVLDASTGDVVRRLYFSNRSHDTLYPLSGPIFQETKASDGTGNYLYLIDPSSYAVSRIGPYSGILGPYAVDSTSTFGSEVWESSTANDPHVYIWDMSNPMAPILRERLTLRSSRGSHWLTFDIKGDYAYVAPRKKSEDGTEIFNARTHISKGMIGSSEDMLEIDFVNGKISQAGDQYGIGRALR